METTATIRPESGVEIEGTAVAHGESGEGESVDHSWFRGALRTVWRMWRRR